jgi:hypothetical protein
MRDWQIREPLVRATTLKVLKEEERFLCAQADTFPGANVKEKAPACFVRNDSVSGR